MPVLVKDNDVRGGMKSKAKARRHSGQWANALTMENINKVGTYDLQYLIVNVMLYTGSSSVSFQKKLHMYREKLKKHVPLSSISTLPFLGLTSYCKLPRIF